MGAGIFFWRPIEASGGGTASRDGLGLRRLRWGGAEGRESGSRCRRRRVWLAWLVWALHTLLILCRPSAAQPMGSARFASRRVH
jgi:hypothetical protein